MTRPVTQAVQQYLPTKLKGYDVTPWLAILLALILRWGCRKAARGLDGLVETRARERSLKQFSADRTARAAALKARRS